MSLKSDVLGGFSGTFVSMVLLTIFGQSIRDPGSNMFWISIGLNVLLVIVSFVAFNMYRRNKK